MAGHVVALTDRLAVTSSLSRLCVHTCCCCLLSLSLCSSCDIALVLYPDGRLHYIPAPADLLPGDTIVASSRQSLDIKPGNCMPLGEMPINTVVHNVEFSPYRGGGIARAAGASVTILDKTSKEGFVLVRMQSKEQRYLRKECMATCGSVSNPLRQFRNLVRTQHTAHVTCTCLHADTQRPPIVLRSGVLCSAQRLQCSASEL
jgi:ribosomal protein L2